MTVLEKNLTKLSNNALNLKTNFSKFGYFNF